MATQRERRNPDEQSTTVEAPAPTQVTVEPAADQVTPPETSGGRTNVDPADVDDTDVNSGETSPGESETQGDEPVSGR